LHSNVAGSSAENPNVADRVLLRPAGANVTAAVGERVSIVQPYARSGPVLPAASIALTAKVCGPSERLLKVFGEAQDEKLPLSTRQAKLLPFSLATKAKVGELVLLELLGFCVIVVVGAIVSIAQP
jgi:hypothetical protein